MWEVMPDTKFTPWKVCDGSFKYQNIENTLYHDVKLLFIDDEFEWIYGIGWEYSKQRPLQGKQCYITTSIAERGDVKLNDIIEIWFPEQGPSFYELWNEYISNQ